MLMASMITGLVTAAMAHAVSPCACSKISQHGAACVSANAVVFTHDMMAPDAVKGFFEGCNQVCKVLYALSWVVEPH